MWITPQPSFARLPGIEDRSSSSSSQALSRPSDRSRTPSADLIKPKSSKKKPKSKGKGKESPDSTTNTTSSGSHTAVAATDQPDNHFHSLSTPPLPHEEDAGPSGFGVANEDYNTLTEEYLEAARQTGYDGHVKDVENEGPLVEGSRAWEEAHEVVEDPEAVKTPDYVAVAGAEEFRNPWDVSDAQGK